jgi:hypothetical protein
MNGPGERRLRRSIKRITRPTWLVDRIKALHQQRDALHANKNQLELQKILHGLDIPIQILNSLECAQDEIDRIDEELDVLTRGWDAIVDNAEHYQAQ